MGDIYCQNCREPWDAYHLRHDLPWEYGDWTGYPGQVPLDLIRTKAKEDGWDFGTNVLVVRHCPACPKDSESADTELVDSIADLLGNDQDALQVMLEDHEI